MEFKTPVACVRVFIILLISIAVYFSLHTYYTYRTCSMYFNFNMIIFECKFGYTTHTILFDIYGNGNKYTNVN